MTKTLRKSRDVKFVIILRFYSKKHKKLDLLQDVELDLDGKSLLTKEGKKEREIQEKKMKNTVKDLLGEDELLEDDTDKDDMDILNDILAPSGGDDLAKEWKSVFGDEPILPTPSPLANVKGNNEIDNFSSFMPSHLLDTQPPAYADGLINFLFLKSKNLR